MIRDCFSNVVQYLTEGTDTMYASGNGCPQVLLCRLPGLTKFYPPYTLAHRIFLKAVSQISLHPNCHSAFRNKKFFKWNFWLTIFGLGHILLHFNTLDDARFVLQVRVRCLPKRSELLNKKWPRKYKVRLVKLKYMISLWVWMNFIPLLTKIVKLNNVM